MKKELVLTIDGKLYNSSYIKIGNKFIVDTCHKDFSGIFIDQFTFRLIHGKPSFLVVHSKTEEIGKQIIRQIDQHEHARNFSA
jgi:hypothetical protein